MQLGGLFTRCSTGDTNLSGFAITPKYRMYLSDRKPALQGFYVGPFLRYQNLTLTQSYGASTGSPDKAEASLSTGGGIVVGHQWLFKQRFSLDAFLKPSYNGGILKVKESSTGTDVSFDAGMFSGFGIRSGVTFGVAF